MWTRKDHTKKRTPKTHSSRLCVVLLGVAHKKRTHTRFIRPESTRCCSRTARKNNDSAFSSTFYYSAFERREGEREREREKRFESYFILFVVGVLKCVSFTETLLLDLRRRQKKKISSKQREAENASSSSTTSLLP